MHNIDVKTLLDAMAGQIAAKQLKNPLLIGIHTGGVWLANELHKRLGFKDPVNTIDITFYRDDYQKVGLQPNVKGSHLPTDMHNRDVILVDDVLFTGRTVRAAMNEIFDYARPDSITLVVLIDRGGRELPIQADVTGKKIRLNADQHIKLSGPDELSLQMTTLRTEE